MLYLYPRLDGRILGHRLARLQIRITSTYNPHQKTVRPAPSPLLRVFDHASCSDIVEGLVANFEAISNPQSSYNPYHPALKPLYTHFVTILCDVCFPFTHSPQELQYIAAARWPGFVKPVIDDQRQKSEKAVDDEDVDMEDDSEHTLPKEIMPPTEDVRMRLNKLFNSSLSMALESLLPRLTNAADWARANEPPDDLLSFPRTYTLEQARGSSSSAKASQSSGDKEEGIRTLPRLSKFILLAAFLASTNPPKSDLRMFGRGLDEKKRKRRVMKKSAGKGGVAKVSSTPLLYPLREEETAIFFFGFIQLFYSHLGTFVRSLNAFSDPHRLLWTGWSPFSAHCSRRTTSCPIGPARKYLQYPESTRIWR